MPPFHRHLLSIHCVQAMVPGAGNQASHSQDSCPRGTYNSDENLTIQLTTLVRTRRINVGPSPSHHKRLGLRTPHFGKRGTTFDFSETLRQLGDKKVPYSQLSAFAKASKQGTMTRRQRWEKWVISGIKDHLSPEDAACILIY